MPRAIDHELLTFPGEVGRRELARALDAFGDVIGIKALSQRIYSIPGLIVDDESVRMTVASVEPVAVGNELAPTVVVSADKPEFNEVGHLVVIKVQSL